MGLLGLMLWHWVFSPAKPPALQAFINANVLTMHAEQPTAEAVLIEGDTIIAVGTTQQITAMVQTHPSRSKVKVHDLTGKTLMPGIIDAHSHFPGSGVYEFAADLNAPPIGNVENIDQLQAVLRDLDNTTDDGSWLFGLGYDDSQMTDARHPLRAELDAVSSKRPILILHVSGHLGVVNSVALRELGIDVNSEPPTGGYYGKNSEGQLTGLLVETAVNDALRRATDYSTLQTLTIVKRASREYAAKGVTTVQNGAAGKHHIAGLKWASKLAVVPQRIIAWPAHGAFNDQELASLKSDNGAKFEVGAIKLVVDGSIQAYTGYLSKPYHVPPKRVFDHTPSNNDDPHDDESFRGKPVINRESLTALVDTYFSKNQQLAIHGNGDAAIDDVLYAVEQAQLKYPESELRTVLIHAQMARKDQLRKMQSLSITPSFFSAHTYYWGDRHRRLFMGPSRAAAMSPAKSAQDLGLPFSIHLDTPVVPMQPMRLIWSAVNRESSSGKIIGRQERISRLQALRAITLDAAYQIYREDSLGSIEVGKQADLLVLDNDPTDQNNDLLGITVLSTLVAGVEIYQR